MGPFSASYLSGWSKLLAENVVTNLEVLPNITRHQLKMACLVPTSFIVEVSEVTDAQKILVLVVMI